MTERNIARLTKDPSVTRVPLTEGVEDVFYTVENDVSLWRLATPLYGLAGEVANYAVVSVAPEAFRDATAVVAVDDEGRPFAAPPLALFDEALAPADALARLGYQDVTSA